VDPVTTSITGVIAFLFLASLGMPIAFSFAIVGFSGVIILRGLDTALYVIGTSFYTYASDFGLVSVPLFILMGQIVYYAGVSGDLYETANKWLGRLPGGLALATNLACTGFAACTGTSLAAGATMGTIAYPEMKRYGYDDGLATGCICSGGTLGILIPPSIIFIVYGYLTNNSIAQLFIAGILPGLMVSAMFTLLILIMCKLNSRLGPAGKSFPWGERLRSLKGVGGMLALFITVIGGLYVGIFTPSEAGSIGAFGALVIILIKRKFTMKLLGQALRESLQITCMAMALFIGAMIFNTFIGASGLPTVLSDWLFSLPLSRYGRLAVILLMYVPLGMFLDSLAIILLTVPIVYPVVVGMGVASLWFGVALVILTEMALMTPPVGMVVYVLTSVTRVPMKKVFWGCMPFVFVLAAALIILVFLPQIALLLPGTMK
jgi:C4-dicarboxylate transporter DctM subunit